MVRSARVLSSLLLALALLGCERSGPASSRVSQAVTPNISWTVDSELARRYGNLPGPGKTTRSDGLGTNVKICLRDGLMQGGRTTTWVAVCGSVLEAPHAQAGWVDLLVFSESLSVARVAAETLGLETGSFGEPGEVSLVHLGAQRRAFSLSTSYSGMGSLIESVDWYGGAGAGLPAVLSTRTWVSNEGESPCDDDSLRCRWEHRRLSLDSSDRSADYFPILVVDSARSAGRFLTAKAKVAFAPDSGRFRLPEPLIPDFWEAAAPAD